MHSIGTAPLKRANLNPDGTAGMDRSRKRDDSTLRAYEGYLAKKRLIILGLVFAVFAIAVWSIMIGSSNISLPEVLSALIGQGERNHQIVVWNLRMPRILTAIVGGIALALAGCAFQGTLRNPLASASTLGVSQGAAFGASVAIILLGAGGQVSAYDGSQFSGNPYLTALCAFLGAMCSTLVVLGLSRMREMTPEAIVLTGVALSALFSGGTTMIQYFAEDTQVAAVIFWTFGDLSRVGYQQLAVMAATTALSTAYFFTNRWNYNAMESGEASAHGLGVNVNRVRLMGMMAASAAASTTVAFCGIINFVGLVAPHVMRRLIGSDYRYLLPASALAGTALLMLSDIAAHAIVAPLILPISAITSFVGAPVFIYLLFKGISR